MRFVLPVEGNGLGVSEFAGASVVVLENDLRVRVGHEPFVAELLGHVEDVVDLDDAEVRVEALEAWEVGEDIGAPADVALARTPVEDAGGGAVHLVVFGNVVHAVVWAAAEFPDVLGDLDGEAIVEVAGEDEDFFSELVPFVDELFAFVEESGPGFLFVAGGLESARAAMGNHEGNRGGEEKEIGVAFHHRFEKPFTLVFSDHGNALLAAVGDVVHVAGAPGVEEKEFAVGDAEFSVGAPGDRIAHGVGDLGGHVELQGVWVDDLGDIVDVRIFVSLVVVELEVVDAGFGGAPVDMEVAHFIEWELGEVGVGIDEEVAAFFHLSAANVDFVGVGDGVGPAEVVVKGAGADVAEDRAAVALAGFGGPPDVVDEFVVVKGEIAGDIAMPLGAFHAAAHVEFVVFPDADDGRSHVDDGREGVDSLHEAPGFGGVSAELFVKPVPVHDVEVRFVGPVAVEVFVNGSAVANAVDRVLIGAGADFEAEVEEALGIVFWVNALLLGRESEEGSGKAVRIAFHENLVVIAGVALETSELGHAGEVVSDGSSGWLAGLLESVFGEAVFDDEFAFLRSTAPNEDGVRGGLPKHRAVGQADGIAVVLGERGEAKAKKKEGGEPRHLGIVENLARNALQKFLPFMQIYWQSPARKP